MIKRNSIHFKDTEYSTLNNIKLSFIRPKYFIGRHRFNNKYDSFMRLEYIDIQDMKYDNVICLVPHYSMGFGHLLNSILSSYAYYIKNKDSFGKHILLNFDVDNHITQLITLISEIENVECVTVKDNITMKNLTFMKYFTIPNIIMKISTTRIRNYIMKFKHSNIYYDNIAILKTTYTRKIDNIYNPRGNLDGHKIKKLCDDNGVFLINHSDLNVIYILKYIFHCKKFVINWGATSTWHLFLSNKQKCLCIVPSTYKHELNMKNKRYKNMIFNKDVFENYIITKPVSNVINYNEYEYLDNIINIFIENGHTNISNLLQQL